MSQSSYEIEFRSAENNRHSPLEIDSVQTDRAQSAMNIEPQTYSNYLRRHSDQSSMEREQNRVTQRQELYEEGRAEEEQENSEYRTRVVTFAICDLVWNYILLLILLFGSKNGYHSVYNCSLKLWYVGVLSICYYSLVVFR